MTNDKISFSFRAEYSIVYTHNIFFVHLSFSGCLGCFYIIIVQSLSHVWLFVTPWTAAGLASLSITSSQSCLDLMSSIQWCRSAISSSVVPFSFCFSLSWHQGLFQWVDSHIKWPKYGSFSFSISLSNEYSRLISLGLTGLISWLSRGLSTVFSSSTVQKHQFFGTQPS